MNKPWEYSIVQFLNLLSILILWQKSREQLDQKLYKFLEYYVLKIS